MAKSGILIGSAGTNAATETCGHDRLLKISPVGAPMPPPSVQPPCASTKFLEALGPGALPRPQHRTPAIVRHLQPDTKSRPPRLSSASTIRVVVRAPCP